MIRSLWVVLVLAVAWPCAAQGNLVKKTAETVLSKKAGQLLRPNVHNNILRQARVAQGKILLGGKPVLPDYQKNIERHLFTYVRPRGISRLEEPTLEQAAYVMHGYHQAMKHFKEFRQEMDPFLYYQSKPAEKRALAPAEKSYWAGKIMQMNFQLEKIRPFTFSQDEAYRAAREYVAYAAKVVDPLLCGAVAKPLYACPNRTYKQAEFFLHAPRGRRSARLLQALPKQLNIAVLNDEPELLENLLWMQGNKELPAGYKMDCYSNTETLLNAITKQGKKPDVILTDIVVPGGGGFYLTGALRAAGYKGVILALSAFAERDRMGRQMFEAGFDGMIYSPLELEYDPHWGSKILDKLRNYYYYSRLHGWQR